ncbi:ATP-binding protein, partial [Syntrophomonas wolfei]
FAQMRMSHLFNQLHDCESEIAASRDELREMSAVEIKDFFDSFKLLEAMAKDISLLEEVLGEDFLERDNKLLIDEQRLLEIKQKIITCLAPWECKMLLPYIKRLRFRPFKELLRSYPENVASLAESLGKSLLPLRITGGDMLVDSDYYHDFCKSLSHVFRNAIDHGLESPEDRLELGKNEYGIISCDIKEEDGGIAIVISDDGRGIDIELLKQQALDRGLCDEEYLEGLSFEEALQLIFADSLSSKEKVSSISGRGMGLPAVKAELEKLGGIVEISSEKEWGTRFCFWLPAHDKIDVEDFNIEGIINPLLETAREFFSREIGITLLHSSEVKRKKRQELLRITAFITIKGVIRSDFILSADEELGRYLVQAMTMDEIESGAEEDFVEDVLAECANIILGNSIKLFPGISELVMMEVPVTLYSDQTAIKHLQADIWTCDFLFEEGRLRLGLISQKDIYSCY